MNHMMMMQMLEIQIVISFSDHFSITRFMVVDIFDYDVDYVRQPKVIHNITSSIVTAR